VGAAAGVTAGTVVVETGTGGSESATVAPATAADALAAAGTSFPASCASAAVAVVTAESVCCWRGCSGCSSIVAARLVLLHVGSEKGCVAERQRK
jgi:hypothetical protein